MEYINIYDDNYNLIGTSEKKKAHKEGLWHEVFTCEIINPKKNTAIFQIKNHKHNNIHDKDLIEITVGGHLRSDETLEDGVREIKEETGLDIKYSELKYLGVRQVATTVSSDYIVREFQNIYLLFIDKDLKEYKCIDDEVSDFIEFDIDKLIELLLGNIKSVYGYTKDKKVKITLDNFVESYLKGDKLYLRLLIAAKRYLNKEREDLIFW